MTRLTLAAFLLFALLSCSGDTLTEYENANTVAHLVQQSVSGEAICEAKRESKTVLCIMNASEGEARKMVKGIVLMVNASNIQMTDWKLTLVTPDDYVISQRF